MKLSHEKKLFALLVKLAIFDGFLAITPARDNIFANNFYSWLRFIYTQLLMLINPKSELIFFLPQKGPPLKFSRSRGAGEKTSQPLQFHM